MHLPPLVYDLSIIIGIAGIVSLICQRIRQPVVVGYIIAGLIIGPYTPPYRLVTDIHGIQLWADLGVIFLMFSLGLEFSFRKLAKTGFSAGFTACFEVLFMWISGFGVGYLLGYSNMDSLFLGAMLSISSTTIIIKALDELKLKTRRFAELIFAILIVEDLVAILILVSLSTISMSDSFSGMVLLLSLAKLILVICGWFVSGYFIIPRFMKYVGREGNQETLTLISMGLCLGLVVFATYFQYSAALGAFIMGSILAESSESHRIQEKLTPLRDLFAAVFFVSIGMLLNPAILLEHLGTVAILCVVTILGKVVSTTFGSLVTGQPLRTSIQVGFGLAQIGEFSFIIATLGMTLKVSSDFLYPIGVAVSLVTSLTTPFLIRVSQVFAKRLEDRLPDPVLQFVSRYSAWVQERTSYGVKRKEFYRLFFQWALNGMIVSIIFVLTVRYVLPLIEGRLGVGIIAAISSWLVAVAISTPSIWAMFNTFTRFQMGLS